MAEVKGGQEMQLLEFEDIPVVDTFAAGEVERCKKREVFVGRDRIQHRKMGVRELNRVGAERIWRVRVDLHDRCP